MAATATVTQQFRLRNPARSASAVQSLTPRHGVVTLFGYGISVRVDRGHLILEDGVGCDRRAGRFSRINHGIKRVVVIGNDGAISLAAIRWLADQKATFSMLDRDGYVLVSTGPVSATDARLRRAQGCAHTSGVAVPIARELITRKLAGQADVAGQRLGDSETANAIVRFAEQLEGAESTQAIGFVEAQAGAAYWAAWRDREVGFPKADLCRVPDHWKTFGPRNSPLSSSPRCAANPANAILNYLYTILESETRLAAAVLGLDLGLGVLHVDRPIRDSLACDLMEPIRPKIDAYLLDWLARTPLKREWFFEQRDGSCRLMGPFAQKLSETALTWSREVAPFVEWFTQTIWSTVPNASGRRSPGTRLTRRRWREATGQSLSAATTAPAPQSLCGNCGVAVSKGQKNCGRCAVTLSREHLAKVRQYAQARALTPEAKAKRQDSLRRHREEQQAWNPADLPEWLDNAAYTSHVQPLLERLTRPAIARALGIGKDYAGEVRAGRRIPHQRFWKKLAELVGIATGR